MSQDCIEDQIALNAPVSRVWQALTHHKEFGEWFHAKLDGPFVLGQTVRGHITYQGFEHYKWEATVQKIEPETLFSFTWHPYAFDLERDYSQEPQTLVEFKLEKIPNGTKLLVSESGFDKIPEDRRDEAFSMHENGWSEQMKNIEEYLEKVV
jgi:uncharacterized protein YndB with AHSA1/START domain